MFPIPLQYTNLPAKPPPSLDPTRGIDLPSWALITQRVSSLTQSELQILECTIANYERARAQLERELQRQFEGIPRLNVLLSLEHLRELLEAKHMTVCSEEGSERQRNEEEERYTDAISDELIIKEELRVVLEEETRENHANDPSNTTMRTMRTMEEETEAKIQQAVAETLEIAKKEKIAAVSQICSVLEPLARIGADVRASELERVFYAHTPGQLTLNHDRELLKRGEASAHRPNIAVDALLYDHRLFTGTSIGQRLGDTHFKTFYAIYPDAVALLSAFPKLLYILNCHFTVKQIQRIPPNIFKISSGPFDYTRFFKRFEIWMGLLRERDYTTDRQMEGDGEAKRLYGELDRIGRDAVVAWGRYIEHNTVAARVG